MNRFDIKSRGFGSYKITYTTPEVVFECGECVPEIFDDVLEFCSQEGIKGDAVYLDGILLYRTAA